MATIPSPGVCHWEDLLAFAATHKNFLTLGKLCCIKAEVKNQKLFLIYDVWEGVGEIDKSHFDKVLSRYLHLKQINMHNKAQQYQAPRWEESPDFIYSPYVAALINAWENYKS